VIVVSSSVSVGMLLLLLFGWDCVSVGDVSMSVVVSIVMGLSLCGCLMYYVVSRVSVS